VRKGAITTKRILLGAYLVLGTFLIAHTVNGFVAEGLSVPIVQVATQSSVGRSDAPSESPRALAEMIGRSGLFPLPPGSEDILSSGQRSEPPAPPLQVAKKVLLLGTVFGQRGGIMAILEDLPTKKQLLYHLGDQVPAVGLLTAIEKNRVLFREGNQEEWLNLMLAQPARIDAVGTAIPVAAPRPAGPQRRVLDRREIDAALSDTTRLLTQAHAVPYLTDGKLDGFRLYSVMPLGFFDKIGLQTNDVLQKINGVELRDPGMLLSLFQQLRNERSIRVDLVRNAQRQTLTYDIR
jgi:general secretion pathway protein C